MQSIVEIFSIMIVSAGFFWGGIPMGLALKFPLLAAGATTMAGAELAVLFVLALGTPLQAFLLRKFPQWLETTQKGRAGRVWQRYGMPGLGLISPVMPGAPQSALVALALGARPGWILLWVSAGILFWGTLVMAGIGLGLTAATQYLN